MSATIAEQAASVRAEMVATRPKGLVRHVERVLDEALDLARHWDFDPERIALATWGHDLFRAHAPAEQLRLAREAGLPITDEDEVAPVMLHGPLAAVVLRERFGVTDAEALEAVASHTTGLAEMTFAAKILLIADKVEKRKRARTPIMAAIRRLARRDLDRAILCWADWKWVDERIRRWPSYPAHWNARQHWVAAHHDEVGLPGRTEWIEI
jgi:predicted HD superfamily hydrolase involved in NAD metabolism